MNRPHTSLQFGINVALALVWALAAIISATMSDPVPLVEMMLGGLVGALGGYMQLLAFKEGKERFLEARTALEVRAKLKETKWGRRYLYFLWAATVVLVGLSISISPTPLLGFLAAYFGMMFIREVVTLKPTLDLRKMQCL